MMCGIYTNTVQKYVCPFAYMLIIDQRDYQDVGHFFLRPKCVTYVSQRLYSTFRRKTTRGNMDLCGNDQTVKPEERTKTDYSNVL